MTQTIRNSTCVVLFVALAPAFAADGPSGTILREHFPDVAGTSIAELKEGEDFPDYPASRTQLNIFEIPADTGESYGTRVCGYIHPPATGEYTFWIASDDGSQLWLSASDDPAKKEKIAQVSAWSPPRAYDTSPEQKSKPITLSAGKKYYIEALHKEGGGGDNLSVGWQLPDGKQERPIPGSRLSPWVPGPTKPRTPKPPPPTPTHAGHWKCKFETTVGERKIKMSYSLYLPKDYEKTTDLKPMLVFLHGAGECGTDLGGIFVHGPDPELRGKPEFRDKYPLIQLSPQCANGTRWDTPGQITAALQLIDQVSKEFRVDKDRVYATGLSMGGRATWAIALEAPEKFAAIAPVSAVAVEPEKAAQRLKNMAVWIICGSDDGGFTSGSKQMFDVLSKGNVNTQLTVFPKEGHGVWGRYYPRMEFYEWLIKNKRSPSKPPTVPIPVIPGSV